MKTIIGLLVAIMIIVGGYVVYNKDSSSKIVTTKDTATTTVPTINSETNSSVATQVTEFKNTENHFTFTYRTNPYGYTVTENTQAQNTEQNKVYSLSLVRTDEYNALKQAVADGENYDGPHAISVSVYNAGTSKDINTWLSEHQTETNCEKDTILSTTLDKQDASSCLWDGLYQGVTVGIIQDEKVYLLTGTREEEENTDGYSYNKDFNDLVQSFKFTS